MRTAMRSMHHFVLAAVAGACRSWHNHGSARMTRGFSASPATLLLLLILHTPTTGQTIAPVTRDAAPVVDAGKPTVEGAGGQVNAGNDVDSRAKPAKPDVSTPAPQNQIPGTPPKTPAPATAKLQPVVPDWEKGISRVSVLDGNLPIAIAVGDAAAAKSAVASGKAPHVFSPYPVKPLLPVPDGWKLGADRSVPATLQRVKLADGRVLEIAVTPPVLQAADPNAIAIALLASPASPVQALGMARKAQAESAAALRALAEALAAQLPMPAESATPPTR